MDAKGPSIHLYFLKKIDFPLREKDIDKSLQQNKKYGVNQPRIQD